jgi:hypothetical protein
MHRAIPGRLQLGKMITDAEQHIVAQQAAASCKTLQGADGLRVHIVAHLADFLEHLDEARARDLVLALHDRR